MGDKNLKICLECAEGGHLDEMLNIMAAFEGHDIFFMTTMAPTTKNLCKKYRVYYVRRQYNTSQRWAVYLREFLLVIKLLAVSLIILLKEKPKAIISTGGGATIPICYLGKLFRVKIIYIQSLANTTDLSGTGKIIYPIADLFLVQWKLLQEKYKKVAYWGRVI